MALLKSIYNCDDISRYITHQKILRINPKSYKRSIYHSMKFTTLNN